MFVVDQLESKAFHLKNYGPWNWKLNLHRKLTFKAHSYLEQPWIPSTLLSMLCYMTYTMMNTDKVVQIFIEVQYKMALGASSPTSIYSNIPLLTKGDKPSAGSKWWALCGYSYMTLCNLEWRRRILKCVHSGWKFQGNLWQRMQIWATMQLLTWWWANRVWIIVNMAHNKHVNT